MTDRRSHIARRLEELRRELLELYGELEDMSAEPPERPPLRLIHGGASAAAEDAARVVRENPGTSAAAALGLFTWIAVSARRRRDLA